ncbi:MAG: glycoside hydrolase family 2 protein, partial [Bacteroidota bacterium]
MKNFILSLIILTFLFDLSAQQSEILYLSGKGTDDAVEWEFYCTDGRNSGEWSTIPVPSNWELHGFGEYNYGHDKDKANEEGLYKYSFTLPSSWKKKDVDIIFVGSMTDTEVKINGKLAGPVHQGAFYQFKYDISDKLNYGRENLLEVKVSKMSSNESVNQAERKADYWVFGGIFRPVYLKASPRENIGRIALDARASGDFYMEVYTEGIKKANELSAFITDLEGNRTGSEFSALISKDTKKTIRRSKFNDIKTWNPEFPDLYKVHVQLKANDEIIHEHSERFGFRTVEIREKDGIYVNGKKVMLKGVNRHSFWPSSGRALSKKLSIKDVQLMKDMNMNAVRMSHYPPDPHFLDVCDSLGLFVLNELAGWQTPAYDTEVGEKLVKEMVTRDVNHPSIIIWDNGNEGGWNTELDDDFALYDPQKRKVIHPWTIFNGMNTRHYIDWNSSSRLFFNGRDIYFPTEILHGLYDGGHGAGLEDFWNLMLNRQITSGMFLWVFSDEGVVRTDQDGRIDAAGSQAPDGIVGPYREKEGSYFTIKEIWSPVHVDMEFLPSKFNGSIPVENRFIYTNFRDCDFEASLKVFEENNMKTVKEGLSLNVPELEPGNKGEIIVSIPKDFRETSDLLELRAIDPYGKEIMIWTWPVKTPKEFAESLAGKKSLASANLEDRSSHMILSGGETEVYISRKTGIIDSIIVEGKQAGLKNGPVLTHGNSVFQGLDHSQRGGHSKLTARYGDGDGIQYIQYDMSPDGWLRIEYDHNLKGEYDYLGANFDFPEENIRQVNMLADGPYRVYKNRMKGPQFGYWEKEYNNTVTGESWDYPEFKGYYSNF